MMRYKIILILSTVASLIFLAAYRYQPQKEIYVGSLATAHTACDASTDATADLSCLNTGDLTVAAWPQVTVGWTYKRGASAAGTAVHIQCDEKDAEKATTGTSVPEQWYLGIKCSGDTCTNMDWTYATASATAGRIHFGSNADLLRCRAWVTSGVEDHDKIQLVIRLATTVN